MLTFTVTSGAEAQKGVFYVVLNPVENHARGQVTFFVFCYVIMFVHVRPLTGDITLIL